MAEQSIEGIERRLRTLEHRCVIAGIVAGGVVASIIAVGHSHIRGEAERDELSLQAHAELAEIVGQHGARLEQLEAGRDSAALLETLAPLLAP